MNQPRELLRRRLLREAYILGIQNPPRVSSVIL